MSRSIVSLRSSSSRIMPEGSEVEEEEHRDFHGRERERERWRGGDSVLEFVEKEKRKDGSES